MATTYYVAPNGNDQNSGLSSGTAFKTLQHASDVTVAGDSVSVLAGNYTGFYQTNSGTISQRIIFSAQSGVTINEPNGITNDGINLEGANYITIDRFTVIDQPRTGIRAVDDTGVIIRNNTCDHCEVWGILTGFSENILIENNICTNTVEQHGIYFGNSADNPVIRNNTCWGNHDCGIHMNGDVSLGGDGIISNALVENNIIYDNGTGGGSAINCDGVQSSVIQNNLLYDNHASGIALFRIDGGGGASNNVVVNNTILQASDARWALLISDGSTGNIVFNNIIYSDHPFRGSISIDAISMNGFHSDYNVQTDRMSMDGGNTVITLEQWQTATQSDENSFISTPQALFQNPAGNDYQLLPGGGAENAGVGVYFLINAPAFDIVDVPRPWGVGFDRGCYELPYEGIAEITQSNFNWNDLVRSDEIQLYEASGKLVFTGTKNLFQNLESSLGAGIYFFTANHQLKLVTGELISVGAK